MANWRRRGKYYPHLPGMVLTMGRHRPFPLVVPVAVRPHWHPLHVHIPLLLGSSATWHSSAWGIHGHTKHITIIEYVYVKQWKQLCILHVGIFVKLPIFLTTGLHILQQFPLTLHWLILRIISHYVHQLTIIPMFPIDYVCYPMFSSIH